MKETTEKDIERALVKRVKDLGGTCEKFTSPGRRSVPDRLVTLSSEFGKGPGATIIFVELKRPKKRPTKLQEKDHERRRELGCEVWVIDDIETARAFPYATWAVPEKV